MRHECIILADSPEALVEFCGISLLERLLRQLQRLGLTRAIVLSATPDLVAKHLAKPSSNRDKVEVIIHARTAGPVTGAQLNDAWPNEAENALLISGAGVFDSRLVLSLDEQDTTTVLVDSAPPARPQGQVTRTPKTKRGYFCGIALLSRDWARAGACELNESLITDLEAGRIASVDISSRSWRLPSLRRDLRPYWFPAPPPDEQKSARLVLLDAAQKGALDLPAMVHAPIENFLISHLCRTSITPNQLTVFTNVAAWIGTFLFATGRLGWGALLALVVGVLDGLDGKQARVKIETSKAGKLEHWFDAFFENSWWLAIAFYLRVSGLLPSAFNYLALLVGAEIVAGLAKWSVLRFCGRTIDEIGDFNRLVRLVGGRRNIYVWLLALGILFGKPAETYKIVAWWGALTAAVQVPRAAAAVRSHRKRASPEVLRAM